MEQIRQLLKMKEKQKRWWMIGGIIHCQTPPRSIDLIMIYKKGMLQARGQEGMGLWVNKRRDMVVEYFSR